MIGMSAGPIVDEGNRTLAIGTPLTKDFCDPQNTTAISSGRARRIARAATRIKNRISASSSAISKARVITVRAGS